MQSAEQKTADALARINGRVRSENEKQAAAGRPPIDHRGLCAPSAYDQWGDLRVPTDNETPHDYERAAERYMEQGVEDALTRSTWGSRD